MWMRNLGMLVLHYPPRAPRLWRSIQLGAEMAETDQTYSTIQIPHTPQMTQFFKALFVPPSNSSVGRPEPAGFTGQALLCLTAGRSCHGVHRRVSAEGSIVCGLMSTEGCLPRDDGGGNDGGVRSTSICSVQQQDEMEGCHGTVPPRVRCQGHACQDRLGLGVWVCLLCSVQLPCTLHTRQFLQLAASP